MGDVERQGVLLGRSSARRQDTDLRQRPDCRRVDAADERSVGWATLADSGDQVRQHQGEHAPVEVESSQDEERAEAEEDSTEEEQQQEEEGRDDEEKAAKKKRFHFEYDVATRTLRQLEDWEGPDNHPGGPVCHPTPRRSSLPAITICT